MRAMLLPAAAGDSVVSQTPQVDAPQGQATSDGGEPLMVETRETSDGGDEGLWWRRRL